MRQKIIAFCLLSIVCISIVSMALCSQNIMEENRYKSFKNMDQIDSGWAYNKTITVYDNREKYQSKITIYNATGRFNCSGNVKNDFSDLRFTAPNGTIIPHWFEEVSENISVVCWVNNYFNNTQIKYYYGNSSATSTSNATETWDYYLDWSTNHSSEFYEHWDGYVRSIYSKQLPTSFNATNGFRIIHKTAETYRYINQFGVAAYLGLLENTNETFRTESDNNTYSNIDIDTDYTLNHRNYISMHNNGTYSDSYQDIAVPTIDDYNVYDIQITTDQAILTIYDNTSNGSKIMELFINETAPSAELDVLGYGSKHGSGDDGPDNFWQYDSTNKAIRWGATNDGRSELHVKNKWVAIGKYQTGEQNFYQANIHDPIVNTNESTGIQETNATLYGYLSDDGGESSEVWFEYGKNTSFENMKKETDNTTIPDSNNYSTFSYDQTHTLIGTCPLRYRVHYYSHPSTPYNNSFDGNWSSFVGITIGDGSVGWHEARFYENYTNITKSKNNSLNIKYYLQDTTSALYKAKIRANAYNWTSNSWEQIFSDEISYGAVSNTSKTTLPIQTIHSNGEVKIRIDIEARAWVTNTFGEVRYFESNITYPNMKKSNETFNSTIKNLDPGQLYWYRAVAKNSKSTTYGENRTFLTKPETPNNVTYFIINESAVNITWVTRAGTNNTIIERKVVGGAWQRGNGEQIYNGTGTYYIDTNVSRGNTYYYQAWSQANWTYNPTIYSFSSENTTFNISMDLEDINVTTQDAEDIHANNATLVGYIDGAAQSTITNSPLDQTKWIGYSGIITEGPVKHAVKLNATDLSEHGEEYITKLGAYIHDDAEFIALVQGGSNPDNGNEIERVNISSYGTGWIEVNITPEKINLSTFYWVVVGQPTGSTADGPTTYSTGTFAAGSDESKRSCWSVAYGDGSWPEPNPDTWHDVNNYWFEGDHRYAFNIYLVAKNNSIFYENCTAWFEWGKTPALGNRTANQTIAPDTTFYQFIDGLESNTTYYYRAAGNNSENSDNGSIMNFTTQPYFGPVLSDESPLNNHNNVAVNLTQLQINITDPDDTMVSWEIETSPNIGSASGTDETVGIKSCTIGPLNANTTYTWHVNATDGTVWTNETYTFTTSSIPLIGAVYPTNNTYRKPQPNCSAEIFDEDGDAVTVTFYENSSGFWEMQYQTTVNASTPITITWANYSNATMKGRRYWWRVNITDGKGNYNTSIQYFYVKQDYVLSNESPYDNKINVDLSISTISVDITDPDDQIFDIEIITAPDIGSLFAGNQISGEQQCSVSGLESNTTYKWYVNLTSVAGSYSYTYSFNTSKDPYISIQDPVNQSLSSIQPECSVRVQDPDGGYLTIKFYENATGSWQLRQTNAMVYIADELDYEDVIWDSYWNAINYDTTYFWKVEVIDDKNAQKNYIFKFTTYDEPPYISNENPLNESTNVDVGLAQLSVDIADNESHNMDWTIQTVPNIGNSSGIGISNGTITCPISGMADEAQYIWFVNVTDGYKWTNKSYTFNTSEKPMIYNPYPTNGATAPIQPVCSFFILDTKDGNVTIKIYENTTGSYIEQYTTVVDAHTAQEITWQHVNATTVNETYYWKVNATNEKNATASVTYKFHTDDSPSILSTSPINGETDVALYLNYLNATIEDPNGDPMSWTIETSPDIGNDSGTDTNGTISCSISGLNHSTNYTWYVNISDGDDWTNKTYQFTTSYLPNITAAYPVGINASSIQPLALVEFDDPDGGNVSVTIRSNASGTWHIDQQNNSVALNETKKIYWRYSNATEYEKKYWWRVNITDGKGNEISVLLNFTTKANGPPILFSAYPINGSTVETSSNLIYFLIDDAEGEAINYTVETSPDAGGEISNNVSGGWKYINTPDIQPNTAYTWYLNATDGNSWTRAWYTFTTNPNNASNMSAPSPSNGSINIPITIDELSIYVFDIDGNNIQWSIETSPDIGKTYHGYQSNGTKSCPIDNASAGVTYTWYVNITDGGEWVTQWFTFRTSYQPTITNPLPVNNSNGVENIQTTCQITINDQDNDPENITVRWYTNESGYWILQQTNNNISSVPTSVGYQYTGADEYNTTYWWRVNVSDGKGNYNEKTFTFTTKENDAPEITPYPANNSENIDIERTTLSTVITDDENHIVNWSIETSPDIGSSVGTNESVGTKICPISGLLPDTRYTWFVNVSDEYGATTNKTYYFNTTRTPSITNEFPANNTIAPIQTNCSIDVYDEDGGNVYITFYEYNGSEWTEKYATVVDATNTQTVNWDKYVNASTRGNEYLWKIYVEDEKNANVSKIYNFTVNYLTDLSEENPENYATNIDLNIGQITINITDLDNQTINWTIETYPNIGTNAGAGSNGTRSCSISTLSANTTYYWWVNTTDGIESVSERYDFSTGNMTAIKNETPPHQSTNVSRRPVCSITVNDPDNDTVDVYFYEKQGAAWIVQQINSSIDATNDVTVTWPEYTNANEYNTFYEWKVIVIDEKNVSAERTYEFTTIQDELPQVVETAPQNLEDNVARTTAQLRAWVTDAEGHLMNWTIETSPNIGSASGNNDTDGNITCAVAGLVCETTYHWYLNISDGYRSIGYAYSFDIARKPRLIGVEPANGEQYISRKPACNITVYDPDGNQVDVTIYEYQSGSWIKAIESTGLNGSMMNNVVWPEYTNASIFNTTYQWKVVAENDKGCVQENIYSFTTRRDWIAPTINWVDVSPAEVQVGMPITFSTNVTDVGGTVADVKLCLSSLGTNISMIEIGNNEYKYITNFSTEGSYVFYIQAEDDEGNIATSDFYSFEIIVKVLAVRMYALERVLKDTQNELLIQISHAKYGTQIQGIENNISIYVSDPNGDIIINGTHPTEIESGLYTIPFDHSNESGTYVAWTSIYYNGSEYMDATSFELRVEEFYNVSGLTDRMQDVFAATSQQSYNSTEEIIAHLRQIGIETGALEQETEKFGVSSQLFDTALSTLFQWIFMTIFLLGAFIVGTFLYGRRKGSKLAKEAANVPRYVVSNLTD